MKFCLLFNLSPCARYCLLIGSQLTTWSQGNLHYIRLHFFQLDREFFCLSTQSCAALFCCRLAIRASSSSLAIMIVGNQLYSSLSLLKRQSLLMLTELPGMLILFERFFQLEYSESSTCNTQGDARIEGYHYCICHWVQHLKHFCLRTTSHFFLTVGIVGVGIYNIEGGRYIKYLIRVLKICMVTTVIVKGHVYYWKYHPCIH